MLAEQLDEADRQAWESVPARLALLRQRLAKLALDDETPLAEIAVFLKAVDYALVGGEWWQPEDLKRASWAIDMAAERLGQTEAGTAPWR